MRIRAFLLQSLVRIFHPDLPISALLGMEGVGSVGPSSRLCEPVGDEAVLTNSRRRSTLETPHPTRLDLFHL